MKNYYRPRQTAIEEEFGEPFWDVVRGFAEQGESRRGIAAAIGMHRQTLMKLLSRHKPDIEFPRCRDMRVWDYHRGNPKPAGHAEKCREARLRCADIRWIEYDGRIQTVADWAREIGVTRNCLHKRLKRMSIERALKMGKSPS